MSRLKNAMATKSILVKTKKSSGEWGDEMDIVEVDQRTKRYGDLASYAMGKRTARMKPAEILRQL